MTNDPRKTLLEAERLRDFRAAFRICASYLSLPLYPSFWLLDLVYAPAHKWEFLGLRLLMIPINLAARYSSEAIKNSLLMQWMAVLFAGFNAGIITWMIYRTDGFLSPYYSGLNLVTVGIFTFFPWSRTFFPIVVGLILGPYYVVNLLRYNPSTEFVALFSNSFFLVSISFVSIVIRLFHEKLKLKEIESRLALEEELKNREALVKQKTDEALSLANLSKQFSPQVVHAIRSGQLNLSQNIHRAKLCAICIDIVNSTTRITRLDKQNVQQVISMFMEDTIKTLLKYDITIDKFMGDGILAFSNDPISRHDYVERVLKAAMEIRYRIDSNQDRYMDFWLNKLEIRIGIATGFADVGFYGSNDTFRTYTAIGRVINLAARLCSSADPNQIVLSGELLREMPQTTSFSFKELGARSLKGFEDDVIKVFELVSDDEVAGSMASLMPSCKEGHGVMSLETDEKNVFVFRCRTCGSTEEASLDSVKAA